VHRGVTVYDCWLDPVEVAKKWGLMLKATQPQYSSFVWRRQGGETPPSTSEEAAAGAQSPTGGIEAERASAGSPSIPVRPGAEKRLQWGAVRCIMCVLVHYAVLLYRTEKDRIRDRFDRRQRSFDSEPRCSD
jgi:hypothetical protein